MVEGRVEITLNGNTAVVKAGDSAVLVPRRTAHSIKGFQGEKLIFREQSDPVGIYKALYVCIDNMWSTKPPNPSRYLCV